jgi:hypothetical protein
MIMRLILEYSDSDGCTYSCTVTLPVVYESGEALLVDFEKLCEGNKGDFMFAGMEFQSHTFFEEGVYYAPTVYTVDEWFAAQQLG